MSAVYARTLRAPEMVRARFAAKVTPDPESGCHLWSAFINPNGYGRFKAEGRMWVAHRVAYILAFGPIPEGMELDHLCRNRACVNPDHLEPVTKLENQLRSPISLIADQAKRTSCPRGHGDYAVRCDGARVCRTCVRDRARASRKAVSA